MGSDSEKRAAVERLLAARRAATQRAVDDQQARTREGGAGIGGAAEASTFNAAHPDGTAPDAATAGLVLVPPSSPASVHVASRQQLWDDDDEG